MIYHILFILNSRSSADENEHSKANLCWFKATRGRLKESKRVSPSCITELSACVLEVLSLLSSVLLFYSQTFVLACLQGWGLVSLGNAWQISLLVDILWLLIWSCHTILVFKRDPLSEHWSPFRAPFSAFTLHYMISTIVTVAVVLVVLVSITSTGILPVLKTWGEESFRLQKETKHCQCKGCGSMKAHASCVCLAGFPAPISAALMECLSLQLGLLSLDWLLPSYCIWGKNENKPRHSSLINWGNAVCGSHGRVQRDRSSKSGEEAQCDQSSLDNMVCSWLLLLLLETCHSLRHHPSITTPHLLSLWG